ncbi:MAG: hypothetical protein NW237_00020 [Cyanobacteriota bacterium]|nr:hypothetical protein [Cyanobacteriota bacterium]
MLQPVMPRLHHLPDSFPIEGAVRIELQEGIPIFRASSAVHHRIEQLLAKDPTCLTSDEEAELDCYEEIDDYLSFVNRSLRNVLLMNARHQFPEES